MRSRVDVFRLHNFRVSQTADCPDKGVGLTRPSADPTANPTMQRELK